MALVQTKNSGDPVYDTFIKRSLGTILPDCIRQLTEYRPADPIEFISNSLYKAVDSQLYRQEKEKYLKDCLRESELLQSERDVRKARLDAMLEEQRVGKEKLRQAREDEARALQDLIKNAAKYGIQLSPKSMRRLEALQREEAREMASERPLTITMPRIKIGPDGKPIVIREGDEDDEKAGGKAAKAKGKWVEVEELVTTESGRVISVKRRKWEAAEGSRKRDESMVDRLRKTMKREYGSVFGDDPRASTASQQGYISITDRGVFKYSGGIVGTVQPPDPLDRKLAPADNPDIWVRDHFECHSLYDHELYTNCEALLDPPGVDKNQHRSPPRLLVREYLESVSRSGSSDSDREGSAAENASHIRKLSRPSMMMSEGEEYRTDFEEDK